MISFRHWVCLDCDAFTKWINWVVQSKCRSRVSMNRDPSWAMQNLKGFFGLCSLWDHKQSWWPCIPVIRQWDPLVCLGVASMQARELYDDDAISGRMPDFKALMQWIRVRKKECFLFNRCLFLIWNSSSVQIPFRSRQFGRCYHFCMWNCESVCVQMNVAAFSCVCVSRPLCCHVINSIHLHAMKRGLTLSLLNVRCVLCSL